MSQDIAALGLKVDSSQVGQAKDELDAFSEAAGRAETAAESVGDKLSESGKSFEDFSENLGSAAEGADELAPGMRDISTNATLVVIGVAAAAAAVGVMTKAYIEGSQESETLARSIAVTGNAAGVAVSQLQNMAAELDDIRGTQAGATKALAEFVATGKVAREDLVRFAAVGQDLERNLGIPIKETVKNFAALADKPSKAAAELQKSFNFLTPAVYSYIVAQEKAGDVAGAAKTAQEAYAAANERALNGFTEHVPVIVRGWRAIKDAAAESWDAMLNIGRDDTPEEKIAELQERLAHNASRVSLSSIQAEIDAQKKIIAERDKAAKSAADLKKETDAYVESQEEAAKKAVDFAEAQKRISEAWTAFDVADIDRKLSSVVASFENANDELEADRAAHLVTDERYFAQRRELLKKSVDAEIAALRQANAALSKQDGLSSVERIAAQNKIAENETRILSLKARSVSQLKVLSTQESAALRDTANAYADAQESAERYVQTLIKRFEIESKGLGLGDQERKRLRDRATLEEEFEQRRQRLDRDFRRGDITPEQYKKFLEIEQDALEQSEAAWDEHYEELLRKQGDWRVGASEAFHNFLDDARNVAKGVEEALSKGFDGALDSLVNFCLTGKGNFGDLINSIIADLLKVELKVQLSKILGPIFGGASGEGGGDFGFGGRGILDILKPTPSFGPPRAKGGPVQKGVAYPVNEDTPRSEWFVAPTDGYISPNSGMGGNVNFYSTNYFGANSNVAQISSELDRRDARLKAEFSDSINRGRGGR